MKHNKIISFTLINAFVLLVFASLLASCEKKLYPAAGHFEFKSNTRTIASVKDHDFKSFQDPGQVYIYCQLNSKDPNVCYENQLKIELLKYQDKFGKVDNDFKSQIFRKYSYTVIGASIQNQVDAITGELQPEINKWVNKRVNFCKQNSKHFLSKCVKQNSEKDSFQVLNKYHQGKKLNGQEYLLLKKNIHSKMNQELSNQII